MNPIISIAALIYRSTAFAQWCYNSVRETVPQLETGEAEFFFVANDATLRVVEYLRERGIPHCTNDNVFRTPEELFALGYGKPEYIHRVYRGWNEAIRRARGEWVCLLNSDHRPAPGWLDSMYAAAKVAPRVVCAQQIECWHPKNGVFPGSIVGEYGRTPNTFLEKPFLEHAERVRTDPYRAGKVRAGGAYMPCLLRRRDALAVGLYPEGNLAGVSFDEVRECGDAAFFRKLRERGIEHVTAQDAVVYHTQEGEMRE